MALRARSLTPAGQYIAVHEDVANTDDGDEVGGFDYNNEDDCWSRARSLTPAGGSRRDEAS